MLTLFALGLTVAPGVVLPLLGIAVVATGGFLAYRLAKGSSTSTSASGVSANLSKWDKSPELQLAGKALARRIEQFGEATGHVILDTALAQLFPALKPLVPAINVAAAAIERQVAGPAPASAPAAPAAPAPMPQLHDVIDAALRVGQEAQDRRAAEGKAKWDASVARENAAFAQLHEKVNNLAETMGKLTGTIAVKIDPASLPKP